MKTRLSLASFRLKNFKAVQDSVEALETFQTPAVEGLDASMQLWQGFEHIWHQAK